MDYVAIVRRALAISWRHKYLWLLALLAGEATTTSVSYQYGSSSGSYTPSNSETAQTAWNQSMDWIAANAALLWSIGIAIALLCVVLFLVSAVANGGLIKGSAEHDAERPFGLGQAWDAGVRTFRPMLGLKFFTFVICVSVVTIVGGLGLMAFVFGSTGTYGAMAVTGFLAVVLLLAAIPFFVIFEVTVLLAARAIVLDGRGMREAFGSALQLIWRRRGRVAVSWVVMLVVGIVASIVAGLALIGAAVPVVALAVGAYFIAGWPLAIATGVLFGLAWAVVALAVAGGVSAFTSTFWTLAYTRLDIEAQPQAIARPQPA